MKSTKLFSGSLAIAILIALPVACVSSEGYDGDDGDLTEIGKSEERATVDCAADEQAHRVTDLTSPAVAAALKSATLIPSGDIETHYNSDGAKVSIQSFRVEGVANFAQGTLECTSSCNGNFCTGSGCEPWAGGCSTFTCSHGCTGGCTKKITAPIE